MKVAISRSALLATSGFAAMIASPGHAQTAPTTQTAQTDNGGGDIIVTARRIEERLQDVPISITVFNQQQLANRNIVNASDLATYTPSLSANSNFGWRTPTFAIRGFVQDVGTAALGRRLFRRRRGAARPVDRHAGRRRRRPGQLLRPAERAGAERPAGHAVRPQHHRRRGAARAAEADQQDSKAISRAATATTTCSACRRDQYAARRQCPLPHRGRS